MPAPPAKPSPKPFKRTPPDRRLVLKALRRLEVAFPHPKTALQHENPFQLLVATILSAQCTDGRVNQVTPHLFRRYKTAADFAGAQLVELEKIIHSTGFYRAKARHIIGCARGIVTRFGGEVPKTLGELTTLPGVGRKTANVVLGMAFGMPGLVVDTHVRRVSRRLQWTQSNHPDRIEADLCLLLPRAKWTTGSHRILLHGRHVCVARKPRCATCPLADLCPSASMTS